MITGVVVLAIQYRPPVGRDRDIPALAPVGSMELPGLAVNEFES